MRKSKVTIDIKGKPKANCERDCVMNKKEPIEKSPPSSEMQRRSFMKSSAAMAAATLAGRPAFGARRGSDLLRVALIGCGNRGKQAARDCLLGAEGVELVSLADMFQDKMDEARAYITDSEGYKSRWPKIKDKIKIDPDLCFTGFDAFEKVMASDVDIVMLATPPHFRPQHLRASVEAGKHTFMEKPAATDATGIRSVIASGEMAKKKGLSIVAGTQQRRMPNYREILKRVHRGDIGEIVAGQCYWHWNNSEWHYYDRKPEWSDMEWQIRCWPYFTWLSGDHIVEQHIHNLDVMNWAIGTHPIRCMGRGGRQTRVGVENGNIFDHFAVEYEYPNGVRVSSNASQIKGATGLVGERIVGTKGQFHTDRSMGVIHGKNAYAYDGVMRSGFQKEHGDLAASVREGKPINEARQVAETTLTAIMGRMSAYTGRAISWEWAMNGCKEDLRPEKYELGDIAVGPIAIPGVTQLA